MKQLLNTNTSSDSDGDTNTNTSTNSDNHAKNDNGQSKIKACKIFEMLKKSGNSEEAALWSFIHDGNVDPLYQLIGSSEGCSFTLEQVRILLNKL